MPKGVFRHLAVTLCCYITNHTLIWRNGMDIQRGSTSAEIIEDIQQRYIFLKFYDPGILNSAPSSLMS